MTNEITTVTQPKSVAVMPVIDTAAMVERYKTIVEIKDNVMQDKVHYGVIPGTDKPTLFKAGAETLCTVFGLEPFFEPLDEPDLHDLMNNHKGDDVPFIMFRYRCTLRTRDGQYTVGSGVGSCNSWEKKYRYRNVFEWSASEEDKAKALRVETRTKKSGNGTYQVYILPNPDIAETINTLDKMAQKRALVAAVLIAVGASNFFTQDIEDLPQFSRDADVIEGDVVETKPAPAVNEIKDGDPIKRLDPNTFWGELVPSLMKDIGIAAKPHFLNRMEKHYGTKNFNDLDVSWGDFKAKMATKSSLPEPDEKVEVAGPSELDEWFDGDEPTGPEGKPPTVEKKKKVA